MMGDDGFVAPGPVAPAQAKQPKRKRLFGGDLRHMMYGFGDTPTQAPDTLDLVEELVIEYIMMTCAQAAELSTKKARLQTKDLLFVLRKKPDKLRRVAQLLNMNKELKRTRRAFDEDNKGGAAPASEV